MNRLIDLDELRRLCAQQPGLTQRAIAKRLGVTRESVRDAIRRHGIPFERTRKVVRGDASDCSYPGARYISLTRGLVAIVDEADYEWLSQWQWVGGTKSAHRWTRVDGKRNMILMHRVILSAPEGVQVDHINGDKFDNRRSNLRLCNVAQNNQNRRKPRRNTSGYKGVIWDKPRGVWRASITAFGRDIYLGRFANKEDAAAAYDAATIRYHGEFARPNGQ